MSTKKGQGAVKKVFGVFFDFNDKGQKEAPVPEKKEEVAVQSQPEVEEEVIIEVKAPAPTASTNGQINENMKQDLIKAIEEANVDGYDYFEFKESLFNMEAVIPIESARFKAAFAAVASMVTPEHLIDTAKLYVDVLNKKEEAFNGYVAQMREEKVAGKDREAIQIEEAIQEKQEAIIKLNQEISEMQEHKKTAQQDAITESAKIQQGELDFKTTLEAIVKKIQSDVTKIKTYLAPPKEEKVEAKAEKVEAPNE